MSTCTTCNDFQNAPPRLVETTHGKLEATAANGCQLCDLLRQVSEFAHGQKPITRYASVSVSKSNDRSELMLHLRWDQPKQYINNVYFHLLPGHVSPWPALPENGLFEEQPAIEECASFIKDRLQTCDSEHRECTTRASLRKESGSTYLPTRLVYIGDQTPQDLPKLYETATGGPQPPDTRYISLSHCWGNTKIVKTTEANHLDFETKGIPWSELCKTFQEAINLTRQLGIDYIWVDSLCIIQDSISDWSYEASRMSEIFSNAYLTIGASAANNGSEGLINRRETRKITQSSKGQEYIVCVRQTVDHELRGTQIGPFPNVTKFSLRNRAWCLQEEFLSPRFVHFTRDEMAWICYEGTTCECNPNWLPRFKLAGLIDLGDDSERSSAWCEVLQHYSKRQISFHQDRLPAISSLTIFFEQGAGRYLAGFWESHLPECLLWWTNGGYKPEPTSISSPPSWSWASVEGGDLCQGTLLCEQTTTRMLDAVVYPSTCDSRGLVSGGYITLQGLLVPLKSMWLRHADEDMYHQYNLNCYPIWQSDEECQDREYNTCHCSMDNIGKLRPLPEQGSFDSAVFLMTIGKWDDDLADERLRHAYEGLLVTPLDHVNEKQKLGMQKSNSELAFVRIGMGMLWLDWTARDLTDDLSKIVTIF